MLGHRRGGADDGKERVNSRDGAGQRWPGRKEKEGAERTKRRGGAAPSRQRLLCFGSNLKLHRGTPLSFTVTQRARHSQPRDATTNRC